MSSPTAFEWDDEKAKANEAKQGVAVEYAALICLDEHRIDFDASRPEDKEQRRKVAGVIEGRLFTVVYTARASVIRLISARRAKDKETRSYG
jgi:uncharacterized DUF497 family protein